MPDVPETVSLLLTLFTGIGLAAAAGLRAFVPLLALGLAVRLERATVLEPFTGLGSGPVLVVLAAPGVIQWVQRRQGHLLAPRLWDLKK